jgi:hypothetical protein
MLLSFDSLGQTGYFFKNFLADKQNFQQISKILEQKYLPQAN